MSSLVPVRPGERLITTIMFFYVFGVLMFYYILDPLRKSLFLSNIASRQLPYAYLLTALCAGAIATITFKLGKRASAISILTGTNLALIGSLFYFRWSMGQSFWYLPWIFFIYVKIVSVLSTTQFWMLAGYIYDNRQAKRIYTVLGAGAGIGAITGSYVGGFLRGVLSISSMILICISVCGILIILSQIAWRFRRADAETKTRSVELKESKDSFSDLWKMVFTSRHLLFMVLLIFLTFIASQIADWQVDNIVQQRYQDLPKQERELRIGEFSGRLSFATNVLSIVFQIFVTGFVVRRLGVLATIGFLPTCLFLSSLGILGYPSLLTAAIARGSDTVSRYSLNRAGIELLYLPLSPVVRKKLKVFIDVFVDRAGRGAAAFVILAFTSSYLPLGVRGTVATVMVLTFVCILVCIALRKTYIESFRQQLKRREIDLNEVSSYVTDPAGVPLLLSTLVGNNERQILYSLQLLQSVRGANFSEQLLPLLHHTSAFVREEAVRTLHALTEEHTRSAEHLMDDPSDNVRYASIEYLCARDPEGAAARLDSLIKDPRPQVRISAARWAAEYPVPGFEPSVELIRSLINDSSTDGSRARTAAAALTLRIQGPEAVNLLRQLLKDSNAEVVAMAAVTAGRAGHLELLFTIIPMLTMRRLRAGARDGLLCFGDRILGTLGDVLVDSQQDLALRREVAWVIGRIPVRKSAELLSENLNTEDPLLRYRVVRALNHLHETNPALPKMTGAIRDAIQHEVRSYYEALAVCQAIETEKLNPSNNLLVRAVRERMDQHIEILFRLLGLEHTQKEMKSAYLAFRTKDRRITAIEFLDNILKHEEKSIILPLLEQTSPAEMLRWGQNRFGIKPLARMDALKLLASRQDAWLKMCAQAVMAETR